MLPEAIVEAQTVSHASASLGDSSNDISILLPSEKMKSAPNLISFSSDGLTKRRLRMSNPPAHFPVSDTKYRT
eukprot:3055817-Pleurochrysis_carterae.AAC.4